MLAATCSNRVFALTIALSLALVSRAAVAQTAVDSYAQTLNNLDTTQPQSVCAAQESLHEFLKTGSEIQNAEAFRAFRAFVIHAVTATSPAFLAAMNKYTPDYEEWLGASSKGSSVRDFLQAKPEIAKAGEPWFQCGFSFYDSEGELYPMQDPSMLLPFTDKLPPDLASYIRFRAQEDAQVVIDDAYIELTWEQLRLRLERWENFAAQHPNLPETSLEVEPTIRALFVLYLFGSDNSPMFDTKNGHLDHKLIASWRTFVHEDHSSRYQPLLSAVLHKLGEFNRTLKPEDRSLFAQFGFEQEFLRWQNVVQVRLNNPPQ